MAASHHDGPEGSQAHLAAVVRSSPGAVVTQDLDGAVVTWNPAAERLYGYAAREMEGRPFRRLIPEDLVHEADALLDKVRRGEPTRMESTRHVDRAGRVVTVDLIVFPLLDEAGRLLGAGSVHLPASPREEERERLRTSVREKEVLLQEIHHRVKNNMQVIASLLSMQARTLRDEHARAALGESRNRVRSMALVHEVLYQANEFSRIDLGDYLDRLAKDLVAAFGYGSRVRLRVESEGPSIDVSRAVNVGLIANELITNALKHAFPDRRRGTVWLAIRTDERGRIDLEVRDDGVGLDPEALSADGGTLGVKVVRTLVEQLDGTLHISGRPGTSFRLEVPPLGGVEEEPRGLTAKDRARRLL